MITLSVTSFNGAPFHPSLSASFDELGGTIGRSDNNHLVLPDPERTISRVHAQVVFRGGQFAIVDRGSNPVLVNGRPLGNGAEAPLQAGDQVQIGGYCLAVQAGGAVQAAGAAGAMAAPAAPLDPFAGLAGFGAPVPPTAPARPATAVQAATRAADASSDPFAAFGLSPSAAPASDPFAGLGDPFAAPAPARTAPAPSPSPFAAPPVAAPAPQAPAMGGIPDDWDPFAAPAPAPAASAPSADPLGSFGLNAGEKAPPPLAGDIGGLGTARESSLDALFDLGPGVKNNPDPFANSSLSGPLAQPNTSANADPFLSLNTGHQAGAAPMADLGSDLNTPFISPPLAKPAAKTVSDPLSGHAAAPAAKPTAPPPARATPAPQGAVLSWGDDPAASGRTIIKPGAARPAGEVPVPPAAPVAQAAAPRAPAAPAPVAAKPLPAGNADSADVQALLAAFREGLAVPSLQLDALTPELMRLVGQLLHESARGTVELLVARAAFKRELRADMTMIVARNNNPLKFSPSVEVALGHLLSPPARGFMAAGPAMRDAYDDLRAHQFGMVAGLRAALEGVLKRFDPAVLEGKLTQKSVLSTLLPSSRKARMWEVFQELYSQISEEAADDFHELFGKAFLQAYEDHIDELQKNNP